MVLAVRGERTIRSSSWPETIRLAEQQYKAKHIQVLKGLEAVRRRPAMYIGDTAARGLHHLFVEVVDNAVDEPSPAAAPRLIPVLYEDGSLSVTDNGMGIPFDIHPEVKKPGVEVAMTMLHAGTKFGGGAYKVSGGLHGVGVSVVNALSEWLEVDVYRDGKIHRQRLRARQAVTKLEVVGKSTQDRYQGDLEARSSDLPHSVEHDPERLTHRLEELAYLNAGLKLTFKDERNSETQIFHEKTGFSPT